MSIELLDRTRKVSNILSKTRDDGEKIDFSEMCDVISEYLASNVYVFSRRGKLLGIGQALSEDGLPHFASEEGAFIDSNLNDRFLAVLSTKENVNLETLGFEEYDVWGFTALIAPIVLNGDRLGTFFLYRRDKSYRIDDIVFCEYCNTVIGLLLTNSLMVEIGEETNKREAISSAITTLTELERKAVAVVIHSLSGMQGRIITSQLAAQYKITRSVMVGALKKLESARLISTQSAGVKGTQIEVLNDIAYDEFERIYKEKWTS